MNDKCLKIGIIGAGNMGSMHSRIISGMENRSLIGICGKSRDRSSKIAKELNIKCYNNPEELISDDNIDIIDICAPTDTHIEFAVRAIKAGKHVIIEFPICDNPRDFALLRETAGKSNKICSVAYYGRYQSQLSYIFNEVKNGKIGEIQNIRISRKSQPYFSSDDLCNNLMSQDIDFMVRLLGTPDNILHHNIEQKQATFIFDYKDKSAIIEGSTNMHKGFPFSISLNIDGSNGSFHLHWRFTEKPEYTLEWISVDKTERLEPEDYDPYQFELEKILSGMEKGVCDPLSSLESIEEATKLTFRCREMIS